MINSKFSLKQKGTLASTQIIELTSERKEMTPPEIKEKEKEILMKTFENTIYS